jgi:hypothetical protein
MNGRKAGAVPHHGSHPVTGFKRPVYKEPAGSPGGSKDVEVQAAFRPWNCEMGSPGRRCTSTSVNGSAATSARASSKSIDKPLVEVRKTINGSINYL